LLAYQGDDVEQVYCRDFVATYRSFGEDVVVPLIPNGEATPVTSQNRQQFVDQYVDWYLNRSIAEQFNAFRDGFWSVLSGHAITLFQPGEIEEMIRGSSELDLDSLQAVTTYDNCNSRTEVVEWFWQYWKQSSEPMQRKILMFITGSDRVPSNGTTTMGFKISVAGADSNRLPTSHTCFNQLVLYEYGTKEKFERLMDLAVRGSEGFGLK
jgi:hypothetical protein